MHSGRTAQAQSKIDNLIFCFQDLEQRFFYACVGIDLVQSMPYKWHFLISIIVESFTHI